MQPNRNSKIYIDINTPSMEICWWKQLPAEIISKALLWSQHNVLPPACDALMLAETLPNWILSEPCSSDKKFEGNL